MKALSVLALLCAVACGDEKSALQGIYVIDTWTENPDSCASEGASILEDQSETHFLVKDVEFFGLDLLILSTCIDLATCQERAANDDEIFLGFGFDSGSDSNGWRGSGAIVGGPVDGGDCSGEVSEFLLTDVGEDRVRMETEYIPVDGVPRDSEGFCSTDAAQEAAEGQPCERLEVLTGTRVEEI
jgi:hypothetical protein